MELIKLAYKYFSQFERETKLRYFTKAKTKSIAPPKANIPRIKVKITEAEEEDKTPGGFYIKDMLRATAYYYK